jgi:hypothetical protein
MARTVTTIYAYTKSDLARHEALQTIKACTARLNTLTMHGADMPQINVAVQVAALREKIAQARSTLTTY